MVCPRVFSGSHSDVSFDSVWFHDDVSFQGATFGDPDHTTLTRFFKVTFGRNASFSAASFNSHTYLNACVVSNFFAFDSTPILCLDHVGHISVDCIQTWLFNRHHAVLMRRGQLDTLMQPAPSMGHLYRANSQSNEAQLRTCTT